MANFFRIDSFLEPGKDVGRKGFFGCQGLIQGGAGIEILQFQSRPAAIKTAVEGSGPVSDVCSRMEAGQDRHTEFMFHTAFLDKSNAFFNPIEIDLYTGTTVILFLDQRGLDIHGNHIHQSVGKQPLKNLGLTAVGVELDLPAGLFQGRHCGQQARIEGRFTAGDANAAQPSFIPAQLVQNPCKRDGGQSVRSKDQGVVMAEWTPEIAAPDKEYSADPTRPIDKGGRKKAFDIVHGRLRLIYRTGPQLTTGGAGVLLEETQAVLPGPDGKQLLDVRIIGNCR